MDCLCQIAKVQALLAERKSQFATFATGTKIAAEGGTTKKIENVVGENEVILAHALVKEIAIGGGMMTEKGGGSETGIRIGTEDTAKEVESGDAAGMKKKTERGSASTVKPPRRKRVEMVTLRSLKAMDGANGKGRALSKRNSRTKAR